MVQLNKRSLLIGLVLVFTIIIWWNISSYQHEYTEYLNWNEESWFLGSIQYAQLSSSFYHSIIADDVILIHGYPYDESDVKKEDVNIPTSDVRIDNIDGEDDEYSAYNEKKLPLQHVKDIDTYDYDTADDDNDVNHVDKIPPLHDGTNTMNNNIGKGKGIHFDAVNENVVSSHANSNKDTKRKDKVAVVDEDEYSKEEAKRNRNEDFLIADDVRKGDNHLDNGHGKLNDLEDIKEDEVAVSDEFNENVIDINLFNEIEQLSKHFPRPPLMYAPHHVDEKQYKYQPPMLPLLPEIDPWAQLRNRHAGEQCLYIGNGPSLSSMKDFSFIKKFNCVMGVNKINMGYERFNFRPNYYAVHNAHVIQQMHNDLKVMTRDIVKFVRSDRWFATNEFNRKNGFVKTSAISKCSKDECRYPQVTFSNGKPITKPVVDLKVCEEDCDNCFCHANHHVVEGNTITYVAFQLLYYMGCSTVYTIGVDHNFVQSGNANTAQKMDSDDPNHFDPNYFKGFVWDLADLASSEVHYRIARDHFKKYGRKIIDATLDGHLNIFPKATQEEFYGLKNEVRNSINTPNIKCKLAGAKISGKHDLWTMRQKSKPNAQYKEREAGEGSVVAVMKRLSDITAHVCAHSLTSLQTPELSLVAILPENEEDIATFLSTVIRQDDLYRIELIVIQRGVVSSTYDRIIYDYMRRLTNMIWVKMQSKIAINDADLWNFAIRYVSHAPFITIWTSKNKPRPKDSLSKRLDFLQKRNTFDFVASTAFWQLPKSEVYKDTSARSWVEKGQVNKMWSVLPLNKGFGLTDLFGLFLKSKASPFHTARIPAERYDEGPIWRAEVMNEYGWFDTSLNTSTAFIQWEFLTRAVALGGRFALIVLEEGQPGFNQKISSIIEDNNLVAIDRHVYEIVLKRLENYLKMDSFNNKNNANP